MDLSTRSYEKELLDGEHISSADIRKNLEELETINKFLGGHRVTIEGFRNLLHLKKTPGPIDVCEIGCGGGDNLKAIAAWCGRNHIDAKFTGIDINEDCIQYASENCRSVPGLRLIHSDYRDIAFETPPGILFSSLFCHHFTDDQLVSQLQWMVENVQTGFFINDLHRHYLAFHSIRLLTQVFSGSYLVKHDAPLSVRRGFIRTDWQLLFRRAGIEHFRLRWRWAFRWLVIYEKVQARQAINSPTAEKKLEQRSII